MLTSKLAPALFRVLQYGFFLTAIGMFTIAKVINNCNYLLISVLIIFVFNVLYGFEKIYERFVFVLFNVACMFFLFGRNIIELIAGENWQRRFPDIVNNQICSIIFISLLFLFFGAFIISHILDNQTKTQPMILKKQPFYRQTVFKDNLKRVTFVVYLFTTFFLLVVEFEKLFLMKDLEYAQYYTAFQSNLPGFFLSVSALSKFCLCAFLATMPKKVPATLVLCIHLISTVPVFIIGQRNSFISAALLMICYYIIRDLNRGFDEKRWFGKFEIAAVIIALPFLLAFLSIYESIRLNQPISQINIFKSIINLFRSQGVTYDVMGKGITNIEKLPSTNYNYTFGPIIEYFRTNSISKFLFGTVSYNKSTIEQALHGNNLDATLSYLELGSKYFTGAGLGSSYMLETFIDFGYIGLSAFSAVLGCLLIGVVKKFGDRFILSFFSMIFLLQIFMVPRSSATGWFVLFLYFPMYLLLIAITLSASFLQKNYKKE